MHKQQLEYAVKHIYGDKIVAHTYLQKFIHVETTLPKRNDNFRSNIKAYIEQLFKLHEISVKGSNNKEFDRLQLKDISYDELDVQLSVSKIPALSGYDNNTGTGKSDYLPKLIKNILFTDSELKELRESNRSQIIEDDCTNARFLSTVIEALSLFNIS